MMTEPVLLEVISNLVQDEENLAEAKSWSNDPLGWCESAFGKDYIPSVKKLRQAAQDVLTHELNLIYSVNATGKSFFFGSMFSLWWLFGRGQKDSKVIVLSSGFQQVRGIFNYVQIMLGVNQERYENKLTQIKIDARVIQQTALRQKGTDVMFGRNPRQSENSKSIILGGHSLGGTLVLAEEADSLTEKLIKDALRNITGEKDRIVAITNPNDPDSYIGRMAKWYEDYLDDKEYTPNEWHITQIGWDDMPTNPKSPDYNPSIPSVQFSNLLQPKTVNSFITSYGTDSAEYNIFVLGRFDYAYKKTFITQKDIGVAITTTADTESEFIGRPILGVDLALFGENKTVAYIRYDILTEYVDHISVFEHTCTEECVKKSKYIARIRYIGEIDDRVSDQTTQAKWVIDLAKNHNVAQIRFDGSGLGAPFQKTLEDEITRQGLDVYGVSLVASRHDLSPSVYFNDRAAWWGQVKQGFIQGDIDIDEQDERLIKELKSLGYNRDSSNRIVLQAKKELSVSPDYADSFVLAALPNESIEAMLAPKKQTQIVELPEYNLPDFGEYLTNPLAGCLNLDPFGDETQDRLAGVFGSNALYL